MKQETDVSLWVGSIASEDALCEYVELDYSDDSAPLKSAFTEEAGIDPDDIDEDFIESVYRDAPSDDLAVLLADCSYADAVTDAFTALWGKTLPAAYNAVILIYHYQHKPKTPLRQSAFQWIGSVRIAYDN